jgi:nucleoside-diphosphate-sugar epimerase
MKILITGSSGFLGINLLNALIPLNCEIITIGRNKSQYKISNCHHIECDLIELKKFENDLIKFDPDILIHLAWFGIPELNKKNSEINKKMTLSLLKVIDKLKSLKKIISTGSCLEYKNRNKECFENDEIESDEPFPNAKNFTMNSIIEKSNELEIDYYWLRVFYLFGIHQKETSLIPSIIKSLMKRQSPKINNPFDKKDYISVRDTVQIIIKIIFVNFLKGIYNVGSGSTYNPIEISKIIENFMYGSFELTNQIVLAKKIKPQSNFLANIDKLKTQYDVNKLSSIEDEIIFLLNNKDKFLL